MNYTEEDYNFIKSWLDKCTTIQLNDNNIYYVTNDNIIRQLKYNRILKTKKEIQINLTEIDINDSYIIRQDLKNRVFWVDYDKIYSFFDLKYECEIYDINSLINSIFYNIFKLKGYMTYTYVYYDID